MVVIVDCVNQEKKKKRKTPRIEEYAPVKGRKGVQLSLFVVVYWGGKSVCLPRISWEVTFSYPFLYRLFTCGGGWMACENAGTEHGDEEVEAGRSKTQR